MIDQAYKPSKSRLRQHPEVPKEIKLRHLVYRDPKSQRLFDFVTSDLEAPAQKIADIYQARWAVELLFRWLKQHLQLREPPYRNKNALQTHLAISLLIRLLVELLRRKNKIQGTSAEVLRIVVAALWHQGLTKCHSPPHRTLDPALDLRLSA